MYNNMSVSPSRHLTTSLPPCRGHKPLAADYRTGNIAAAAAAAADANIAPAQIANSRRLAFETPSFVGVGLHRRPGGRNHISENHQRKSQFLMHHVAVGGVVVVDAAAAGLMESRHS